MTPQRGRKSAANVSAPNINGTSPRLTAPASMTTAERQLFNELIAACAANHFRRSDIPLITSYVEATLMARAAARDPERFAIWERAIKLQCTLSTRLRLTPSARSDPKTVARGQTNDLRFPWESTEQHQARMAGQQQEDTSDE